MAPREFRTGGLPRRLLWLSGGAEPTVHDSRVNRRRWRLQQKAGIYSSVAEIRNDPL